MNRQSNLIHRCQFVVLMLILTIGSAETTLAASLLGGLGDVVEATTTELEDTSTDLVSTTTELLDESTDTSDATLADGSGDTSDGTTVALTGTVDADVQAVDSGTLSVDASGGTLQETTVVETTVVDTTDSTQSNRGGNNRPSNAANPSALVGEAQGAVTISLGETRVLADTGALRNARDTRLSSLPQGEIEAVPGLGGLLSAEVIHATTTAGDNQVDSTASLADLSLDVAGITSLAVEFVRSEARSTEGGNSGGRTIIEGLTVAGDSVTVDGVVNQVVPLVSGTVLPTEIGQVIINEHESIPGGVRVNAIHVIVYDVGEIIIASSAAALP